MNSADPVGAVLDRLVPPSPEAAEWDDVLTRARGRPRRWRRASLAFAVAVLALGVPTLAISATARRWTSEVPLLGGRIFGDEEASITYAVNGKTWTLARARNNFGESCLRLTAPAGWIATSCLPAAVDVAERPVTFETAGTDELLIVMGFVAPGVKTLELVRSDCSVREVRFGEGLFLSVSSASSPAPYAVLAFDETGARIFARRLTRRGRPVTPACKRLPADARGPVSAGE